MTTIDEMTLKISQLEAELRSLKAKREHAIRAELDAERTQRHKNAREGWAEILGPKRARHYN